MAVSRGKVTMYRDEEKKYDIRVVEKYIQEGVVTREEYGAYLEKLPDVASSTDDEYHFEFPPARKEAEVEPSSPPRE